MSYEMGVSGTSASLRFLYSRKCY